MAKVDPMRSLRAKLQHAQRDAKAARELSSTLTTQFAQQSLKLTTAERERDKFRGWWQEERKKVEAAQAEANEARTQRDNYRTQFESDRDLRRNAERERDLARANAEAMRRMAYPDQPQFPWEEVTVQVPVGPYDPMTGMWKGAS